MGIMYCFNFYILDLLTCLFGCESQLLGFYNDDVFYIFRVWFTINVFGFVFLERVCRLSASLLLTPYTHSQGRCSQHANSRLMGVTGIHLQCITACYTIRRI
jgi:hypothetical protein